MAVLKTVAAADVDAALAPMTDVQARDRLTAAVASVSDVVWGVTASVRLLLAAVMARGHVLIEDVPGVGKTSLARAVAQVLGGSFSRIQFTADMLPADVLGVHVFDPKKSEFQFKRGPIFAQVVLADEINRASPKTQSAMLEAMSDRQVTVDEATFVLPRLFTVLATQNPVEHHGAYPLPESQLDRFMVQLKLGYPPAAEERHLILAPEQPEVNLHNLKPVLHPDEVVGVQRLAARVTLSEAVADYMLAMIAATRSHRDIALGCSPRGAAEWAMLARAWAFIEGRNFVLPDDLKTLAPHVLTHRLVMHAASEGRAAARQVVDEIVGRTPVPR